MIRDRSKFLRVLFVVIIMSCLVFDNPNQVSAKPSDPKDSYYLWVGLITPNPPSPVCIGSKIELEFYFTLVMKGYTLPAPVLSPSLLATATIKANNKLGVVSPGKYDFTSVYINRTSTGTFSYTAKKKGKEEIAIEVSMWGFKETLKLVFDVQPCPVTIQFNQKQTYAYDIYSMETTYSGSGTLEVNDDGVITGSGGQQIVTTIPPFSEGSGSCTQTPFEGSSGMAFNGQVEDEGDVTVSMELEALAMSSSTLTCQDEDYSGSMTFPSYTYSSCTVQLEDLSFEGGTVDVPIECPGEESFDLPITVIPRRPA